MRPVGPQDPGCTGISPRGKSPNCHQPYTQAQAALPVYPEVFVPVPIMRSRMLSVGLAAPFPPRQISGYQLTLRRLIPSARSVYEHEIPCPWCWELCRGGCKRGRMGYGGEGERATTMVVDFQFIGGAGFYFWS